jgi:hypothetical protein
VPDEYGTGADVPRSEVIVEHGGYQLARPFRSGGLGDVVGAVSQCGHRVADRNPALRGREEIVIVLGVADRDRVVRRHAQLVERGHDCCPLGDPWRHDHDGLAIHDHLVTEPQVRDRLEGGNFVGLPREHDHPADVDRHPTGSKPLDERVGRSVRE